MNTVTFSGNYGGPSFPEVSTTRSGKKVLTIPVFVSKRTESGWTDVPRNVTIWEKLAENVANSLKKGDRVIVTGREQVNEWNDRATGKLRSRDVVVASDIGISMYWNTVESHRQAKDLDDDNQFYSNQVLDFEGNEAETDDIPM